MRGLHLARELNRISSIEPFRYLIGWLSTPSSLENRRAAAHTFHDNEAFAVVGDEIVDTTMQGFFTAAKNCR
jgi:hypothetical protein